MKAFDKVAPGLYSKNTLLYGVEVKFYSSKVAVDNHFETAVDGLYAIGDGARHHPRPDAGQRDRRRGGPGHRLPITFLKYPALSKRKRPGIFYMAKTPVSSLSKIKICSSRPVWQSI